MKPMSFKYQNFSNSAGLDTSCHAYLCLGFRASNQSQVADLQASVSS